MKEIIECVPNISEGQRDEIIQMIVQPLREVKDLKLLSVSSDKDHNRTVITVIGTRDSLYDGILKLYERAIQHIDLKKHKGEHPRAGAIDVCPFVPIKNVSADDCIALAKKIGSTIAEKFHVPVYLYEDAASKDDRKDLANIRKGEFEGFFEKIKLPEWAPDFGPREVHASAGITVIGARMPLIAYNINLNTPSVDVAKKIAKVIRQSGGGLRYVKALGMMLHDRNIAQVSINMTNFKLSSLFRVFEMVKSEARRYGVSIMGSEIVGLVPQEALIEVAEFYLQLENFDPNQILENKIHQEEG
jgi:glutamate formiminotransferase / 5-formyltetrahydrofolate cyclo-ligase